VASFGVNPISKSTVSTKGQVTLPAVVRQKLGLTPGTAVQFELHEGAVLLRKGSGGVHPVDQVFGLRADFIDPSEAG